MYKLMRIEWRKNKISKYILSALITMLVIAGLIIALAMISKQENEDIMGSYAMFVSLTNAMIGASCTIISSIIIARLIIDEYRNNTIQLLYTYPLSRYNVIYSKLAIAFIFTLINVIVSTAVVNLIIYLVNPYLNILEFSYTIDQLINSIISSIVTGFGIAGVSFIAMYFGMRKKSVAATITSATIIAVILNSSLPSNDGISSLGQFIFVSIGLGLIGFTIAYLTSKKMANADIV